MKPQVMHCHLCIVFIKRVSVSGERGASEALETETQSPSYVEDYLSKILGYSAPGNWLLRLNPSTLEVAEGFGAYARRAQQMALGDCHHVALA